MYGRTGLPECECLPSSSTPGAGMEEEDEDVVVPGKDERVGWGRAIEEEEEEEDVVPEAGELAEAGRENETHADARFFLREAMMLSSMLTSISAASSSS